MPKEGNNNLPATTAENIILLIDTLKKKNKNESEVKALFGNGDSVYSNTKSALKAFGFIVVDGLTFTSEGREIAYSQDSDKKVEMAKVLKNYRPYEVFLLSLLRKDDISTTEIEEITNFWGKAKYGSKQRNREDAAKLFMSIIDYCDYGKYIIGRGNNPTRVEWTADIKKKIEVFINESNHSNASEPENNYTPPADEKVEGTPVSILEADTPKPKFDGNENGGRQPIQISNAPNIVINVDMSDWTDEKIKPFFKYAYGKFEEV